ncbi:hypothetical protein, partial [Planomonospora algeriensis]
MFLSRLLAIPADVLRDVVPDMLAGVLPRSRRVRACPGGIRIDLHVIGGPGTETAARLLEARLRAVDGVERAEVNGALGCVFVGIGGDRSAHDELLSIVTGLDRDPAAGSDPEPHAGADRAPAAEPGARGAGAGTDAGEKAAASTA